MKAYKDYGSIVTKQWILDKFGAKVSANELHVATYILINMLERLEKLEADLGQPVGPEPVKQRNEQQ